jgi:phage tail sheath protein FI
MLATSTAVAPAAGPRADGENAMPEYLAPEVFVEETAFRSKSVEGVGTSVAGVVGPTRSGPVGRPVPIASFDEFERVFGDGDDLAFPGGPEVNHTALAVRAFFDNGGRKIYVARVASGVARAAAASAGADLRIEARYAGAVRLALEARYRDGRDRARFDLLVRRAVGSTRAEDGPEVARFDDLTFAETEPARSVKARLSRDAAAFPEALVPPVLFDYADAATAARAFAGLFDPTLAAGDAPRFVVRLEGGSDGVRPGVADYRGSFDERIGGTGCGALEGAEDVSIVLAPASAVEPSLAKDVAEVLLDHCLRTRYRVGVVDPPAGLDATAVRDYRRTLPEDGRLALYYPWICTAAGGAWDPARAEVKTPPSGFVAGAYARTDAQRGVHKASAGEPLIGVVRFESRIDGRLQDLLNPDHVNCLRDRPGLGNVVWGARTLDTKDPAWKYVNVRRYFLYLEQSIERSTQWVAFEPNGEALWDRVRATVENFLFHEWREGRLLGAQPQEAYFVRCDRSTMTQNDLDCGRLICVVGAAPLRPGEFVVFRLGRSIAGA